MSDTQRVWLITGYVCHPMERYTRFNRSYTHKLCDRTNRGIGLELTRQLSASSNNVVIAACRNPATATALNALAQSSHSKVHIIALDITDRQSVQDSVLDVASILEGRGVDYLINNAGIVSLPINTF